MEVQVIEKGGGAHRVIANSIFKLSYLAFGNNLKILRSSSTISCPMTWGSSSSGYITIMLWFLHRGAMLIRIGCTCA
jgi:hypothetical protein